MANIGILFSNKSDTIEKHVKWVQNTQEEVTRMKTLVEDMLFLAKSDADQSEQEMLLFNFSDTVWNCILTFEPVAFEKGVEIETDISTEIVVKGNESQLKQLMMILLDNACKYAGIGQGKSKPFIYISLVKQQNQIYLKVNNTGAVISGEAIPYLFERFYREDESRARQGGGYGLGLSIAKSIVNTHHGHISVVSNEREGTTFTAILSIP